MRVAIYARVSTNDKGQDPENQLRELRAWCEAAVGGVGTGSGHTLLADAGGRRCMRRAVGTHLLAGIAASLRRGRRALRRGQ